jgi:signal transduction histidine kinase/CheY-like chemotaxis protein
VSENTAENTLATNDKNKATNKLAFRREQVKLLFGQLNLIYLADVVAGTFLFFLLIFTSNSFAGYVWYGLLLLSTLIRSVLANKQKLDQLTEASLRKNWLFLLVGAIWSGLIWGFAWTLLPTNPSFLQLAAIGLWLAGMLAGAATTMSVIKEVYLGFAVPAALIFLSYSLFIRTEDSLVLAIGFVLYLGFITPIAIRIGNDFNRSISLQTKNNALKASLLKEAQRLQIKKAELEKQKLRAQALESQSKLADEQLKTAAEERLLLLDAVGEGIFGVSNRGDVTFINSSALKMLNMNESELIGKSALRLISSSSPQSMANVEAYVAITRCFQKGIAALNMEGFLTVKDRVELPVRFSCTPVIKNAEAVGSVVSFVDVSNQKDMEAMLLQSQKMEAMGRLTGGVAHDFNNLLTVIMGNLQFLKKRLKDDEKACELADKVMQAAKNGADLNSRLLSFSRQNPIAAETVNISELVSDLLEFMDRLVGEDVTLHLASSNEDALVFIDKTQLQNALLNLCVNSKDAMPTGGDVFIDIKVIDASLLTDTLPTQVSDQYVQMSFTDSGSGIPQEIREKIFEPFFTTKSQNQGTGLGLSTVYGFIKQSGGNIVVESELGCGTTFKLYIPVTHKTFTATAADTPAATPMGQHEGIVLVVEDDLEVRKIAIGMLETTGFKVLSAIDAVSGLEQFISHPEITIVFSDIIMPGGMNGIEMAEQMLLARPEIPILLATGYADKASKERILENTRVKIVAKPYDTDELPKLIAGMLSSQN